jgi:UDPglucose 6-dehydrogenase
MWYLRQGTEGMIAIIGYGWVGKAYHKMFPDAVIYDEPQKLWQQEKWFKNPSGGNLGGVEVYEWDLAKARAAVNECDIALVCVPTNLKDGHSLDMSIVSEVVSWIETPLILIKSALQPGTVDRLVEETGKKIAVSVEMVGEGKYFVPYWKYPDAEDPTMHDFLIVGGETETASACAEVLWGRMSPDINIHITTALEAEITKLMENTWGAMKVTFGNTIYDVCQDLGANYIRVLQAWGSDGRTEKMHMRVVSGKRGWKSKCYDKDVPTLAAIDKSGFIKNVIQVNEKHLEQNPS